jgi:hypothetical protein
VISRIIRSGNLGISSFPDNYAFVSTWNARLFRLHIIFLVSDRIPVCIWVGKFLGILSSVVLIFAPAFARPGAAPLY